MKRIAIMQPYFLPYIGYFQLIQKVDKFVVYDDVQFTKKGWINRNSVPSKDGIWKFTVACDSSSETSKIFEKRISNEFKREKFLSRIRSEYGNFFNQETQGVKLVERIIDYPDNNLFNYISNSILEISNYLNIPAARFIISSEIGDFTNLKSQEKVIGICRALEATHYLNPISGSHLYQADAFIENGLTLEFFKPTFENESTSMFSVIDSILRLSQEKVIEISKLGNILTP